jgi:hypothetical protein
VMDEIGDWEIRGLGDSAVVGRRSVVVAKPEAFATRAPWGVAWWIGWRAEWEAGGVLGFV